MVREEGRGRRMNTERSNKRNEKGKQDTGAKGIKIDIYIKNT
jgi:hypothetical protein